MRPSEILEKNRDAIREATKRFNAANPRVFGSVARGEDGPESDIDILVDALPGTTQVKDEQDHFHVAFGSAPPIEGGTEKGQGK